jgi:ubiquinone/menaquinone biosynthesis C-methylase UbiE
MEDTDYALGRTDDEYNRLIEQAELFRPLTERMLRAAGIGPGMHVLDVGCGVGDVSFLVSELVGPEGSVVGVDLDRFALSRAEDRRATRGISNVVFRVGDARSPHSEHPFDAAVGRFVLLYMRDPTVALRCIAARVRSGGILAFQEVVGGTSSAFAMNLPILASLQALLSATFERSGASMGIGGESYERMRDAGLEPDSRPLLEIAVCAGQAAVARRRWALLARSLLPKIVEYGLANEDAVLDIIERRLPRELNDVRSVLPLSWLMSGQWARKP